MDYIVDNYTVAVGSGDTPPASGTPGEATSGNPSSAPPVPSTKWPAWAWNMILGSCRGVIVAAGLTPSRFDRTLLLQSVKIVPPGRLLSVQTFSASGTYAPNARMATARIRIQGGGGAGSGCNVPTGGNVSLGAPGTAGAYAEVIVTAAQVGASAAVTVGPGGARAAGASGGAGGTSSVGSLVSAPGGIGGLLNGTVAPPYQNGNGSQTAAPTVGSGVTMLEAEVGGADGVSSAISSATNSGTGAAGGRSKFGAGGFAAPANTGGASATNAGAGGGGTFATSAAGSTLSGGQGAAGKVIIEEYS